MADREEWVATSLLLLLTLSHRNHLCKTPRLDCPVSARYSRKKTVDGILITFDPGQLFTTRASGLKRIVSTTKKHQ